MTQTKPQTKSPIIGVFDSGFGGLTVLRALLPLIPNAHYIYLGDTARLPYGSKSRDTIARYAVSSAKFLHEQGAELLVIACNTATALALENIQQALPIPVIGVVAPGAQAALAASTTSERPAKTPVTSSPEKTPALSDPLRMPVILSGAKNPRILLEPSSELSFRPDPERSRGGVEKPASQLQPIDPPRPHVLVLATSATVQSRAYTHALNTLGLEATEKACPLLVPLVEEGWINHPVTDEVLKIYLTEALTAAPSTKTLLLGCTHYPLIEPAIHRTLASIGHPLNLIDSADATARAVAAHLGLDTQSSTGNARSSQCTFYATDSIEKFQRLGSSFLGQPVAEVNLVDLGG